MIQDTEKTNLKFDDMEEMLDLVGGLLNLNMLESQHLSDMKTLPIYISF